MTRGYSSRVTDVCHAGALQVALAESARWGDTYRRPAYTRDVEWEAEYSRLMDEYFPYRTDALITQLQAVGLYAP